MYFIIKSSDRPLPPTINNTHLCQYCNPQDPIRRLCSQTVVGVQLAVVTQELELEGSGLTPDTVLGPALLALAPVEHDLGHLVVVGERPAGYVDKMTVLVINLTEVYQKVTRR